MTEFYDTMAKVFRFPDYFGRNLDALEECLNDLFVDRSKAYRLLIVNGDQLLCESDERTVNAVFDILAGVPKSWQEQGVTLEIVLSD